MLTINIKDRIFKLTDPTPFDGCAIFNYFMNYKLPFNIPVAGDVREVMSPAILEIVQKLFLKYINEELESGLVPIADSTGNFQINSIDAKLLAKLTSKYIDFFTESWLKEDV